MDNINFRGIPTSLFLNGPKLGIVTDPQSVSNVIGVTTFTGIATASFPNPTDGVNDGSIAFNWYFDGSQILDTSEDSNSNASIVGFSSATGAGSTITISGLKSEDNGKEVYFTADYIPTAYSQPVGSVVTAGTARSTGNAFNEPLQSGIGTITVFPVIEITSQPTDQIIGQTFEAEYSIAAKTTPGDGPVNYQWQLDGNDLSDGSNTTIINKSSTSGQIKVTNNIDSTVEIINFSQVSSYDSFVTGRVYTLTADANITTKLFAEGGGGGTSRERSVPGGAGGSSEGTFTFVKDQPYTLVVGGSGYTVDLVGNKIGSGGFQGGGEGNMFGSGAGGGGGGYTGLFTTGGRTQSTAIIIAGGGGGGANDPLGPGGAGGGLTGGAGGNAPGRLARSQSGGEGGTQQAGGHAGIAVDDSGTAGSAFQGGKGAGGGGGGYYGGGAGGGLNVCCGDGAGGGGSGYIGGVTDGTTTTGAGAAAAQDGSFRIELLSVEDVLSVDVTDVRGSISVGTFSGGSVTVTRYNDLPSSASGTEGHPVGSIGYFVDITYASEFGFGVSVSDTATRGSGLIASDNSIAVSSGYPQTISSTRYKIAFDMTNSQGAGRQATYIRSFAISIASNQATITTNISGSNTDNLTISSTGQGFGVIRCKVSATDVQQSPVFSNTVSYVVVGIRNVIKIEQYNYTDATATLSENNLSAGGLSLSFDSHPGNAICLYAGEKDIDVEVTMYGGKGSDNGSASGGEGGYSKIRFTMKKDEEYVLTGLFDAVNAPFLYRKATLIAVVGGGGDAGGGGSVGLIGGDAGDGGGIGISGENATRSNTPGGQRIEAGTLSSNGIFGSLTSLTAVSPDTNAAQQVNSLNPTLILGGRAIPCTRGVYWRNQGKSPCEDLGTIKFRTPDGTEISNTAEISRGYKSGYNIIQTKGRGGGDSGFASSGNGGAGATGGDGGSGNVGASGGGGSGYTDGSVDVIRTQIGGSTSKAKIDIRIAPPITSQPIATVTSGTLSHTFNNASNTNTNFQFTGAIINAVSASPGAADQSFDRSTNQKHYVITMNSPYSNITVSGVSVATAGGGTGNNSLAKQERVPGSNTQWRLWFQKSNGFTTYVRGFTITGIN